MYLIKHNQPGFTEGLLQLSASAMYNYPLLRRLLKLARLRGGGGVLKGVRGGGAKGGT